MSDIQMNKPLHELVDLKKIETAVLAFANRLAEEGSVDIDDLGLNGLERLFLEALVKKLHTDLEDSY